MLFSHQICPEDLSDISVAFAMPNPQPVDFTKLFILGGFKLELEGALEPCIVVN
jgi:hypothetical protein